MTMSYPPLPISSSSYLTTPNLQDNTYNTFNHSTHPGHHRSKSNASASASSVEPITPELRGMNSLTHSKPQAVEEGINCRWKGCDHVAQGADELYDHLCNVHVGRKSTNNLCLTCGWEGCGVKCVKRDHITSHLRVHTPLKPHPCGVCGKTFKRPQDLKKHERIHTQEHHQLHKLSKATTSNDPVFNERVAPVVSSERRRSAGSPSLSLSPTSSGHPSSPFDNLHVPSQHPNHAVHKSVSPTPSALAALHKKQHEELAAYQQREMLVLQQLAFQQQQSQLYAAQIAGEGFGARLGQKRDLDGEDGGFEGFLMDMKKRKVEPVYDSNMMNRLNGLVPSAMGNNFSHLPSLLTQTAPNYQQQPQMNTYPQMPQQDQHHQQANSMGLPEIRTEADLAMFNQFMLSLGRDAITSNADSFQAAPQPMMHGQSYDSGSMSNSTGSPLSDQSPIEDLFNAEELASLGLAGMPGIPIPTINTPIQSHDLPSSLPSNTSISFGNLYPSLDNLHLNRARTNSAPDVGEINKRTIASLPRNNSIASSRNDFFHPTYPNPANNSYPELPIFPLQQDSNQFNFDTLAKSRAPMYTPTMAPRDFYKKAYRHVAPLGTAMSSRLSAERTDLDDEEVEYDSPEDNMPTPKISVRSLLLSDEQADPALKLPAINSAPSGGNQPLPSLNDLTRKAPAKRHTEDDILRGVKRMELDDQLSRPSSSGGGVKRDVGAVEVEVEMRRRHAQMIRGWLVAVNLDWKRKELERTHREEVGRLDLGMGGVMGMVDEEEEGEGEEDEDEEMRSVGGGMGEDSDDEMEEGGWRGEGGFAGYDRYGSGSRMREIVGI